MKKHLPGPLTVALSGALLSLGALGACSGPTSPPAEGGAEQATTAANPCAPQRRAANPCAPQAAANPCAPAAASNPCAPQRPANPCAPQTPANPCAPGAGPA